MVGRGGAGEVAGDATVALEYRDGYEELVEGDDEEEVGDEEGVDRPKPTPPRSHMG